MTIQYIFIVCDGQIRVTAISTILDVMGTFHTVFTSCFGTFNDSVSLGLSRGGTEL